MGVLRGGVSNEYDVSLKTGAAVLKNLPNHYTSKDVLITRGGDWHLDGVLLPPHRIFRQLDVIWNALHGRYGEDGQVQKLMDHFGVIYTGSGVFGSMLGMNKEHTKGELIKHDIKMAASLTYDSDLDDIDDFRQSVFRMMPPPWVIKPVNSGSSVGVTLAYTIDDLVWGLEKALFHSARVIVEEYIRGREATCGVIDDFRGEPYYPLPPVQIIKPKARQFFDYTCKYDGTSQEICPGHFKKEERDEIERIAALAHRALGLRHYSRSDMIVSPRGVYFLEINSLPGLTEESLLPKALEAVGCSYSHFLDHVINLALKGP